MSNRVKIVAWNCCRGLHEKFHNLIKLEPNLAVVSECAEIDKFRSKAPLFSPNLRFGSQISAYGVRGLRSVDSIMLLVMN